MDILEKRKVDLRKQIKPLLKGMDPTEKARLDHEICMRAMVEPVIANAASVYAYMALSWEADLSELLDFFWEQNRRLAFPRVCGRKMDFFEVRSREDLEEGAFHILEPKITCPKADWKDAVILVPGIAFSCDGKRLGKGGGFYDQYLKQHPGHPTIALAYGFQMRTDLQTDDHDMPVDGVITEADVFVCEH